MPQECFVTAFGRVPAGGQEGAGCARRGGSRVGTPLWLMRPTLGGGANPLKARLCLRLRGGPAAEPPGLFMNSLWLHSQDERRKEEPPPRAEMNFMLKSLSWECKWLTRLQAKMTFLGKGGKALRGSESEKLLAGGRRRGPGSCRWPWPAAAVSPEGGFLSSPGRPGAEPPGLAVLGALVSGRASGRCAGRTARRAAASREHGGRSGRCPAHTSTSGVHAAHGRPARRFWGRRGLSWTRPQSGERLVTG